jgi:hypothetical protein
MEVRVSHAPIDFSSLSRDDEKRFVPFELAMRDNGRRANLIGGAVALALLAVILLVVGGLYSPCNTFCRRPPSGCKTAAQIETWRAGCANACSALEHAGGLTVDKDAIPSAPPYKTSVAVSGTEYVQTLNACVFSGGADVTCNSVVKEATARGLWCADGK